MTALAKRWPVCGAGHDLRMILAYLKAFLLRLMALLLLIVCITTPGAYAPDMVVAA
ncbi:MAG: hypothetical protein QM749_00100 [Aquabacterium sp.]